MNLKDCCILVTPTTYAKNDPRLKTELESLVGRVIYNTTGKPLSSEEVASLLPGVDGYIAGLDVIDHAALQPADRLKVIARYGVGVDKVDLDAAQAKGIVVTNTPGANSTAVAELAAGLILALARRIPEAVWATRRGEWPRLTSLSLEGKTIGLLGFGSVGRQLATRLNGFGCHLLAHDPWVDEATASLYQVHLVSLEELMSRADYLSLHLPLLPETHLMVNAQFLSRLKPGAFLINTARGELVDEAALAAALQEGRLAGAALDVFTQEPPAPDHPLLRLPNVIATPHMAAHTDGATNAMGWMALEDCLRVLRGQEAENRVV